MCTPASEPRASMSRPSRSRIERNRRHPNLLRLHPHAHRDQLLEGAGRSHHGSAKAVMSGASEQHRGAPAAAGIPEARHGEARLASADLQGTVGFGEHGRDGGNSRQPTP